jgi:hypothetical protein
LGGKKQLEVIFNADKTDTGITVNHQSVETRKLRGQGERRACVEETEANRKSER